MIAFEVAERLIDAGKSPVIVSFSEDIKDEFFIRSKALRPLAFGGRVIWYAHVVAVSEGMVFDPVLPEPVPLAEYSEKMFGESISWKLRLNTESIQKRL